MTYLPHRLRKAIEYLEDELASLQFDIDRKHHSGMVHISLMAHMDKLKCEKDGLELDVKCT